MSNMDGYGRGRLSVLKEMLRILDKEINLYERNITKMLIGEHNDKGLKKVWGMNLACRKLKMIVQEKIKKTVNHG